MFYICTELKTNNIMEISFEKYSKLIDIRFCAETMVNNKKNGIVLDDTFKRLEKNIKDYEELQR